MINILGICDSSSVVMILYYVKIVITLITLVTPIILIVSCMISAVRGVTSGDLKNISSWIPKMIAAAIIFFIPTLVFTVIDMVSSSSDIKYCYNNASLQRAASLKETEKARKEAELAKWKQEMEKKRQEEAEKAAQLKQKERDRIKKLKEQVAGYETGWEANSNRTTTTKVAKVNLTDIGCSVTYAGTPLKHLYFNVSVADEIHGLFKNVCSSFIANNKKITKSRIETAGAYVNKAGYHGRGLAVDLYNNWKYKENGKTYRPYAGQGADTFTRYQTFICEVCNGKEDCDKNINYQLYYNYFKNIGWCWGGNWSVGYFDPMHFEKSDGGCSTTKSSRISCK